MPFLRINGHQVFVRDATPVRKVTKAGRRGRSFRGVQRDARRAVRRAWDMQAVILESEDANALMGLLWGEGHQFDFADGLQASTGLGPRPGYGAVRVNAQAYGANGRGVLQVPAVAGRFLQYDAQLRDDEWTLLWSTYAGFTWNGSVKRSDGVGYRNGARNDNVGEPGGLSPDGVVVRVTDGVVDLINSSATVRNMDDLVVLPYKMTETMMAAVSQPVTNGKFGPCPVLVCSGDFFGGRTTFCVAEVQGSGFSGRASTIPGIGWVSNAQVVRFTLMELEPGFATSVLAGGFTTPRPPAGASWWFDAQDVDGTLNATLAPNAGILTWIDKGSRGQNAFQGVAGQRPLLTRIGEPGRLRDMAAVLFDGVDDRMVSTTGTGIGAGPITMASVHRFNATGVNGVVADGVDAAGLMRVQQAASVDYTATRGGGPVFGPVSPVAGRWDMSVFRMDGASSVWRVNGSEINPGNPGTHTPKGVTLGAAQTLAQFLGGYIVELLVWPNGTVSLTDVEAYFEAKYGSLPQT